MGTPLGHRLATIVNIVVLCILMNVFASAFAQPVCSSDTLCTNPDECCSRFGYCGFTGEYCGDGCQSGSCWKDSITAIINGTLFDQFLPRREDSSCPSSTAANGGVFYTYDAFLTGAGLHYGDFCANNNATVTKRELAAFFAHAAHETGGGCYVEQIDNSDHYCDTSSGVACGGNDTFYYGRGPLQLKWNYNYFAVGDLLGFNGVTNPERLATSTVDSVAASIWWWMDHRLPNTTSSGHDAIANGDGFGATVNILTNGVECGNTDEQFDRVELYKSFCEILEVGSGSNLYC